jgi:carnitine-CoA ligase
MAGGAATDILGLPFAERTLGRMLELQADRLGERPFVRYPGGARSYVEMRDRAATLAAALAAAGVVRGDRVAIMSGNRIELLDLWLACGWLGAALVPINTASRGPQLAHVLRNASPRILVVEPEQLSVLDYLDDPPAALERIWLVGSGAAAGAGALGRVAEPLPAGGARLARADVHPAETSAILYTSGTTGPSKGVQCPHAQFFWWAVLTGRYLEQSGDDTLYTILPLFHTNALNAFCQALLRGATFEFGDRFSASRFWSELASSGATVTYLLGAMVAILLKGEPSELDRAHRCRIALAPATPREAVEEFRDRFGIVLVDGYGSTETNMVLCNRIGGYRPGTMGLPLPEFEAIVVDGDDRETPAGTAGELVVRPREPFSCATGYFGEPEKTVEAWRNLWFHTGDRVVRDEDGVFRFLDRIKDAIRRRGENISSWEVEQALQSHPAVATSAVVPVPSELGEDEVMAFVVAVPGADADPVALVRHLEPRLAYFAIPRYVEFLDELPLTENGKIQKFVLRERGPGPGTWDREAAGYRLSR